MHDDQARTDAVSDAPEVAVDPPGVAIRAAEAAAAPATPTVDPPGRRRWLALAFVGLVSLLVLLGPTGVGAAASTLLSGDPYACGGP